MAIGKTASSLILAGALWASAAQFQVRHDHWQDACTGVLTVDENAVSFAGGKGHAWAWKLQDIQELRLAPGSLHILTYRDSRLRLGADAGYDFTGSLPAEDLYALLRDRMDQRLVVQLGQPHARAEFSVPVKHQGRLTGSEGILAFTPDAIVYETAAKNQSRTWRYQDIDGFSSSGRFQLTITTLEKGFNFQLKQPITEARYNEIWLQIEKKNGRIQ